MPQNKRWRIAFSPDLGGGVPVEPEVAALCRGAADRCRKLGAQVADACPDLHDAGAIFQVSAGYRVQGLGPIPKLGARALTLASRLNQPQAVPSPERRRGLRLAPIAWVHDSPEMHCVCAAWPSRGSSKATVALRQNGVYVLGPLTACQQAGAARPALRVCDGAAPGASAEPGEAGLGLASRGRHSAERGRR